MKIEKNNKKISSERIRKLLKEKNIKNYKIFCESIGCNPISFGRVKNGKSNLGIAMARKIANEFGVSADYLMGLNDEMIVANNDLETRRICSDSELKYIAKAIHSKILECFVTDDATYIKIENAWLPYKNIGKQIELEDFACILEEKGNCEQNHFVMILDERGSERLIPYSHFYEEIEKINKVINVMFSYI